MKKRITAPLAAAAATAALAGGMVATAPSAHASGTVHGCPSGAFCIYPGKSWSGTPKMYWSYGAHNLSNEYGTHLIFNNQYGGAWVRTCTGYSGRGCQGYGGQGWSYEKNLTPINSIVLGH